MNKYNITACIYSPSENRTMQQKTAGKKRDNRQASMLTKFKLSEIKWQANVKGCTCGRKGERCTFSQLLANVLATCVKLNPNSELYFSEY